MPMRSPFRPRSQSRGVSVRAEADAAELLIYDEIGFFGIIAKDVLQVLRGIKASDIAVRINSPGGDVTEGVAIYNLLRQHGAKITVHIDGLAASIASVIAMAGDQILMADNAFFMIHDPWGITIGTARDHRATAEVLDKVDDVILATYMKRADAEQDQVKQWMDEETWFTAEEAMAAGFIDEIVEAAPVKARFDLSVFRNAPAPLREAAPAKASERDLERILRDAGLSRSEAKTAVAAIKPNSLRDADEAGVTAQAKGLLRHLQTLKQ